MWVRGSSLIAVLLLAGFLVIGSDAMADEKTAVTLLIVYHSQSGHTKQLAESVKQGAESISDVRVIIKAVTEASAADFVNADAILFGSPVHNGNITTELQTYINSLPFKDAPYTSKVGAAFVTAGGISAGEEAAMHSIHRAMLILGMIVVGGGDWRSAFGASAIVNEAPFSAERNKGRIAPEFVVKGYNLGIRVAQTAIKLAN
jgi:NAD(P)H dehydrogenase (quinone)